MRGSPIRTPRRAWTTTEVDKLLELAETNSPPEIARLLRRSPNSIYVKLKKLKVSLRTRLGWFTQQEVCEILGVDSKWIRSRNIPKVAHNPERQPRKGKSGPWHISEEDLREFIREHPEELIGKNVDIVMLVDVLAGIKGKNVP